jgi:hypothetical protein
MCSFMGLSASSFSILILGSSKGWLHPPCDILALFAFVRLLYCMQDLRFVCENPSLMAMARE